MLKPAALILILLVSACAGNRQATVNMAGKAIAADVADTPEKRQKGLMGAVYLEEARGMLFVFPDEAQRSFWMKNTTIPLDIIFISGNMTIVDIQSMEPCFSSQCPSYLSNGSAKYALEVNKGLAEKSGISAGGKVRIEFHGS